MLDVAMISEPPCVCFESVTILRSLRWFHSVPFDVTLELRKPLCGPTFKNWVEELTSSSEQLEIIPPNIFAETALDRLPNLMITLCLHFGLKLFSCTL